MLRRHLPGLCWRFTDSEEAKRIRKMLNKASEGFFKSKTRTSFVISSYFTSFFCPEISVWQQKETISPWCSWLSPAENNMWISFFILRATKEMPSSHLSLLRSSVFSLPSLAVSSLHAAASPAAGALSDPSMTFQKKCHGCHTGLHATEMTVKSCKHRERGTSAVCRW